MHEQSETIRSKTGKWINVYGRDIENGANGRPLPLLYTFEKPEYDTVKEAEKAARKRSQLEDKPEKATRLLRPERL
jgi:hypothetical protein